jgi:hypothetical protein
MKRDNSPLIVAVFLVVVGLLSGVSVFDGKAGATEVASARRSAEFFISTAQGAENATTLFSARTLSPITAVSDASAPNPRFVYSTALGAVKDIGMSAEAGADPQKASSEPVHVSSLSR